MFALHVSDTHLGAVPSGLLSRARDVYEVFKETIDIALKEHVDIYIHAGDFFNTSTPPPEAYVVAYRGLKKLKDRGIKIVAIAGQHDIPKKYAVSPLAILRDVGVVDVIAIDSIVNEEVDIGNKKLILYCVPYTLRNKIPSVIPSREGRAILIAHLLLKDVGIPSPEADISLDMIPSGFHYIALGDYHIRTVFRHRDGVPAVYPGATEVHRLSEHGEKYVALVDLSKNDVAVNFIELQNVRPWIIIQCDDVARCVNNILENAKTLLSKGRKKPLAYILIEKIRTEILSNYLDDMVSKGSIEYYILSSTEQKNGEEIKAYDHSYLEQLEHVDVLKILVNILGEESVARHLLDLIENPDKQLAEQFVNFLRNNESVVKELEAKIRKSSIQEMVKSSQTSTTNNGSKSLRKLLK
ncbi:MAG: DNA repair exonuclease [Ignisphaera sp.]